ncbi:MAG: cytochrome c biogenesis protein CcsA [Pseudomonadota bacterium]
MSMFAELPWIWLGVAAYAAATLLAVFGAARGQRRERTVAALLLVGVTLFAVAIGVRWERVGHGPFISMFEILASNLFSLGLVFGVAYWRLPVVRPSAVVVLPVLLLLGAWIVAVKPVDSFLPPSFETPVLWFHLVLGKLFLGTCLVGVGVGGVILLRRTRCAAWFAGMPDDGTLDMLAWRVMLVSLIFESLMLVAGAVWAQDAWGRYWAWDPLETWAFMTWLTLAFSMHARIGYRIPPWGGALMIWLVFVLAFLTFLGVPFLSAAPHKGVV